MKTLEETLINNSDTHFDYLLLNTAQVYNKLESVFYTTNTFDINKSYDMKEKYIHDYKLSLGDMYYNIGLYGRAIDNRK